jgi:hypothetical protein
MAKQYDLEKCALILTGKEPPPDTNGGTPAWNKIAYKRYVKYLCMSYAATNLSKKAVRASWAMTGILRAMGFAQTVHHSSGKEVSVVYDGYVAALEDGLAVVSLEQQGAEEEGAVPPPVVAKPMVVQRFANGAPPAAPAAPAPKAPAKRGRPSAASLLAVQPKVATGPLDKLFQANRQREEHTNSQ